MAGTKNTKNTKKVVEESEVEDVSEVEENVSEEEHSEEENVSEAEEEVVPKAKGKSKPVAPKKGDKAAPVTAKGKKGAAAKPKGGAKGKKGAAKAAAKDTSISADVVTAALSKSKREGGYYNVDTQKVHTKSVKALKEYVFYTLDDDEELRIAGVDGSEALTNALTELGYPDAEPDATEEKEKKSKKPAAPSKAKGAAKKTAKGEFVFTEAELRKTLASFSKSLTEALLKELKSKSSEEVEEEAPKEKKSKGKNKPEPVSETEEPAEAEAEGEAEETEPIEKAKTETKVKSYYHVTLDKSLGLFVDKNSFVFASDKSDSPIIGKVVNKKVVPLTAADVKEAKKISLRLWQVTVGKRDASKLMTQKEVDEQVKLAKTNTKAPAPAASDKSEKEKVAKQEKKTEEAEGSEVEAEGEEAEEKEEGGDDGKTSEAEDGNETDADPALEAKAEEIRSKGAKVDPVEAVQKVHTEVLAKPDEVTKDEFKRILEAKNSGAIMAQTDKVATLAKVTPAKVKAFILGYPKLAKTYADVVEAVKKGAAAPAPTKARLDEPAAAPKTTAAPKKLVPKTTA